MNLRDAWLRFVQNDANLFQGQVFMIGKIHDQTLAFWQISDCVRKPFLQVGTLKANPCVSFGQIPKLTRSSSPDPFRRWECWVEISMPSKSSKR
jgi:hypothetical protein